MISRRKFAGLLAASVGCARRKPFDGYAFVANEEGNAVAVVDLALFTVVHYINLDAPPTALILHPAAPLLYALTPAAGVVHEIDVRTLKPVRRSRFGGPVITMRLTPTEPSALYVLSKHARRLVRVPLDSFKPESGVALPADPEDFDLSTYTDLAGIGYGRTGFAGLVDLKTGKHGPLLPVGKSCGTVRFRSGGKALLVANPDEKMLTVLDAPSGQMVTQLPLAVRPENFCFNQDGGQLFITGAGLDAVVVVYPHDIPQVAETALAGRAPGAMAASTRFLFVANPLTNDVSIFNADTRRLVAVTAVGASPNFIAITPDQQYALVLNQSSGDMAVINIQKIQPSRTKSAPLLTMIPVGSKPVAAVVREMA